MSRLIALQAITGLWSLFVLVWFVGALRGKKVAQRQSLASEAQHRIPMILGVALYLGDYEKVPLLAHQVLVPSIAASLGGLVLTAAGIAFAFWARFSLGGNWSGAVTVKHDHQLVRSGPYALARHPIYTGMLLGFLGSTLALGTVAALAGWFLVLVAFLIKSRIEERVMRQQFGQDYVHYASEVRALIPYVW